MKKAPSLILAAMGLLEGYEKDIIQSVYAHSPFFYPKKHTVETYRSQQRKAKKRKKH